MLVCPLFKGVRCGEYRCAWFIENECAIVLIAKALSNGHSELKPKLGTVFVDTDGDCEVVE